MFYNDKRIHDYWEPPETTESQALLIGIVAHARIENQSAARRLRAAADLFEMRREQRGERAEWAVDTWAAVGAEIAAALKVSLGRAGSILSDGLAMLRLPCVAEIFEAGDIDLAAYRTIVYRTELITDESVMAEVDQILGRQVQSWPSLTQGRLMREIDRLIVIRDPDAVRCARERRRDRDVTVWFGQDGTADIAGRLFAADGQALDKRLDALAATVCENDPRNLAQRRADALGALAAGAERLMCRCEDSACAATASTPSPVVIHVVADQSTLDGRSDKPGHIFGQDALIPPDLLRELARSAKLRPLIQPRECAAEPRYTPSRTLADFVRARDLTCRAPGCDRPATQCDLDHTVPYPRGATHRSNIKCLCSFHHLLKTFWGWLDKQLPDGTVIWTLPDGHTYVTTPGSALLFPALMAPTGESPVRREPPEPQPPGDRTAKMPPRRTSRTRMKAQRILAERRINRRLDAPF